MSRTSALPTIGRSLMMDWPVSVSHKISETIAGPQWRDNQIRLLGMNWSVSAAKQSVRQAVLPTIRGYIGVTNVRETKKLLTAVPRAILRSV